MTTTTRPDRTRADGIRLSPARRRFHVPTLLAGVLLVVGCALAFGVLAQHLTDTRAVLVLARPVARGTVLSDADLAVAQVSADTAVRVVRADDRQRLLGRTLLLSLPAGTALTAELVAAGAVDVGPTSRTIGLLLEPGGYPTSSIAPGDTVSVVDTGGAGDVLDDRAVVLSTEAMVDGAATRLVSIVVDARSAAAISAAAAQDRVRLLLHRAGR
ncbi:MAG TPA: SAF domain-containing protein [Euzebyales bacterium]|nr:SAF domain-containing protein [Euzebyales bacterium]